MTGRGLTTQNFVDHSDGQSGGYLECHGMLLGCVKWGLALVYILQESEVAQSCPTLCDPMDSSLPGSMVHGIFQARILEWAAISFSRGIFPTQGSNLGLLNCRQTLYHLSH